MQVFQVCDADRARRAAAANAGKNKTKGKGRPATANMDYSPKQMEFMAAIQEFKRVTGHQFPTWCEVLSVIEGLGYRKPEPVAGQVGHRAA